MYRKMLNKNEERELSALIEEMQLTDDQRRERRMEAAQQRLEASVEPPSEDEFVVTHLGFTREEWLKRPKPVRRIIFDPNWPDGAKRESLEGANCYRRVDGADETWEFWEKKGRLA
jgi:hypothetical protein